VKSIGRWQVGAASGLALAALALGCSSGSGNPIPYDAGVTEPGPVVVDGSADTADGAFADDGGQCAVVVEQHPDEGASHIPCTSPADYLTKPPSSGNHYPTWPDYKVYDQPIRWGHLVHAMEHGGVVIVYNCPDGCADDLARAQAFVAAGPPDADCSTPRVILAPDPTLEVKWAASAWRWTLRADCFDDAAMASFVADHLGHASESICGGYPLDQLCTTP
jgi:hypothetical protein